jgi:hypothetical protein
MSASATTDVAFSPAVKRVQQRLGSRAGYARLEAKGGWPARVTPDLAGFIAERTSVYLATASADGQPYIQHRGGPKGFLKLLDDRTLAFADFAGNRQYITLGNLSENPKAMLFLMDYANRRRVKIWGRAKVVEDDPELLSRLSEAGYDGRPERAVVIAIEAWDVNCPQHIPVQFDRAEVAAVVGSLRERIAQLEAALTDAGVPVPAISRETGREP